MFRCVDVEHSVAILSAVFFVICSLMFVSDASGLQYGGIVLEYGSCYGFVCCEHRFPHVVDVSSLSICIVLRAFVVVISMYLFM